jgi:uncharacterized membrane protein
MKFLKKHIEKSGGGDHELAILVSQVGVVLLYASALAVSFLRNELLLAPVALFAVVSLWYFTRFNTAERFFFGGLTLLGVALAAARFVSPRFDFALLAAYVFVFTAFFALFMLLFHRDWTEAVVEMESGGWAVLRTSYDLQSGVRQGWHAVRTERKLRRSQKVKAKVKGMFGERVPWEIES